MLYSVIFTVLIVIEAVILRQAFLLGYNLRAREDNKPVFVPEKPKKKKVTKEELKYEAILTNLEKYNGTSDGQMPIKER